MSLYATGTCADTGTDALIATALHRAADSLAARVEDDGRWTYRVDELGRARGGYNVLRHAGALWVMQDYHRQYPDPGLAADIQRASHWLQDCCLRALTRWPFEALWSVPENQPDEAKLGGAGLSLAAWNGLAAQGLTHPPAARLNALAQFIVYLQKPDGSFHSKYRHGRRDDRWVSLYYPGEAALGLLSQYRRDADPRWMHAAILALQHLAGTRAASGVYPPDHWAVIATAELAAIEGRARPELMSHAQAVVTAMLAQQSPSGDFGFQRRSAPTATRLEALAALLGLMPNTGSVGSQAHDALDAGARFLTELQVSKGPWIGALRRAATDSTDPRRDELRIDDTQHALSVWLAWCRLQKLSCKRP